MSFMLCSMKGFLDHSMYRSMLGADKCTSITNKFVSTPTTITVLGVSVTDKAVETINASASAGA